MKIGFDGKRAVFNNTGLGNYSRLIGEQLASRYPDNEYIFYTPRHGKNPRLQELMKMPNVLINDPDTLLWRQVGSLWRIEGLTAQLKRDKVDLFHGLSGELPLNIQNARIPSVVTIHDLIFRRIPENYTPIDARLYDYKFRHAAKAATRIIAISECTKRDIVKDYGVDPAKIDVVYQGCHPQFTRRPSDEEILAVKRKYHIPKDAPYIISVGTIEKRKNQLQALRGIRGLSADVNLVIVGRRHGEYGTLVDKYIKEFGMQERVRLLDNVEFADLPALYAGAFCSSYTSQYEGFGIPVIESISVGTPVIVASGSCLEEAGGPMTPVVEPGNVHQWISAVRNLFDFPTGRAKVVAAGLEYVKKFNHANFADGVMNSYLRAVEDFNRAST